MRCTVWVFCFLFAGSASVKPWRFNSQPVHYAKQISMYSAINEKTDDVRPRKITGIGKFAIISTATQLPFDASLEPSIFSWTG